jgi:hypothetical protein
MSAAGTIALDDANHYRMGLLRAVHHAGLAALSLRGFTLHGMARYAFLAGQPAEH